jgi:hypothetical protein
MGSKLVKRSMPLWLVLVVIISTTFATVGAITIYLSTFERINLFAGVYQNTDFTILSQDTSFKGKNGVTIKLTLKNIDSAIHSADVTVQLLDSSGDIITIGSVEMSDMLQTGSVAGLGTVVLTYNFRETGLVALFDSQFIIIKQVS